MATMKKLTSIAWMVLLAACGDPTGERVAGSTFQSLPFSEASLLAAKEGKVVLVDFFTTWCEPCKRLDRVTWTDPDVIRWLEDNTIALKIDAEKEVELAARYKVDAYPTILLARPDGEVIDKIIGFHEPEQLLTAVEAALGGRDSLVRAREEAEGGGSQDPMARMDLARQLSARGQYEEALEHYLWCFDDGRRVPAFAGVRLSFLLNDIQQLGANYPPALEALRERRNEAEASDFSADPLRAMDAAALNRVLGEEPRSLELFDRLLAQGGNGQAVFSLLHEVRNELIVARRYDDLLRAVGDVNVIVDLRAQGYAFTLEMNSEDELIMGLMLGQLREEIGDYYEALLVTDQTVAAEALAGRLLGIDASETTLEALARRADRAEKTELASDWKVRAARARK